MMRFNNPTTGVSQRLCLASHDLCTPIDNGPKQLQAPGVVIAPGQTLDVRFFTAGDYRVISTTTPHMILVIHVNRPPSSEPLDDCC